MDFTYAATTLAKPAVKLMLEVLASRKRAQLADLVEILKERQPASSEGDALSSLNELKRLKFVEEQGAALPRWNTYYVTADGLEATRKLLAT